MTKCLNEGCENEAKTGWKYCDPCYQAWRARQAERPTTTDASKQNRWHGDDLIDILMKVNSNSGRIVEMLERIATALEQQGELSLAVAKETNTMRKPRKRTAADDVADDLVPEAARHG